MICVSIKEKDPENCLSVVERFDFAEIRMDGWTPDPAGIQKLFSSQTRLIATCRAGSLRPQERKELLMQAIDAGAAYVDIGIDNPIGFIDRIIHFARLKGCSTIISYHNHTETPSGNTLHRIMSRSFLLGADIVKMACLVRTARDNARLLGLLDINKSIVVVGMGALGTVTRILGPLLGSPFTYASVRKGNETAEGQINYVRLQRIMKVLSNV